MPQVQPASYTPTTLFDASLAGLLSVVFEVFAHGLVVERLERTPRYAPGMFGEPVTVATDEAHAKRVWEGLGKFKGFDRELILRNWLFDTVQSDTDIVHLMVRMFREQSVQAAEDYRDAAIFRCKQVHKKMFREIHRTHAFVRFAEAGDGLYFARIDPDFDVLPLAIEHFEDRYQDQEWMIWDGKRNYGFWFQPGTRRAQRVEMPEDSEAPLAQQVLPKGAPKTGHGAHEGNTGRTEPNLLQRSVRPVSPPCSEAPELALSLSNGCPNPQSGKAAQKPKSPPNAPPTEDGYQHLWSTYFDAVNIEARANPRLHRQHVPLRYWRHLTEKRHQP